MTTAAVRTRRWRTALGAAGVAVPLFLTGGWASAPVATPAGATAHHPVYILDCVGNHAKIKPQEIVLACADYGILVRKASWTHWGDARATASATLTENDCIPDCADGSFHSEPASVTVTRIAKHRGRYYYRHIRVVPKPPNRHHFTILSEELPG